MSVCVSREQIAGARRADLYHFLVTQHAGDVLREGKSLRLKSHDSIVIRRGYSGYVRYSSNDEKGNAIDLLCRYLGYSFTEAVEALSPQDSAICEPLSSIRTDLDLKRTAAFPPQAEPPYRRVFAYLTKTRGLSFETVRLLVDTGLLYQDSSGSNAVFINHELTYCEIRGTFSSIKFHRVCCEDSLTPGCWYFKAGKGMIGAIYICEGAIDAISLYELHKASDMPKIPALYCSIGGVGNQRRIDWIVKGAHCRTILAVDNDSAGDACRKANPLLEWIIPSGKDWNEDLLSIKRR